MGLLSFLLFLLCGATVGKLLYRRETPFWAVGCGLLTLVSLILVIESVFFYIWKIPPLVHQGIEILLLLFLVWRYREAITILQSFIGSLTTIRHWRATTTILFAIFTGTVAAILILLATHPITDAVRSPWDRIPPLTFYVAGALYALEVVLLRIAWRDQRGTLCWFVATLGMLPLFLLAWLVFPIGFGFDPFIHHATEQLIAATGTITPKPLYYIGHYSIVTFFAHMLGVSVARVDALFVPLIAAFLLPWLVLRWIRPSIIIPSGWVTFFTPLTLPFLTDSFTITTPQAFANLLFLCLLFLSDIPVLRWILLPAILVIHPITGIAAALFVGMCTLQRGWKRTTWALVGVISFPLAFLAISSISANVSFTFTPSLFLERVSLLKWIGLYRENRFNSLFNLLYFYAFNIKTLFVLIVAIPIIYRFRSAYRTRAWGHTIYSIDAPFLLTALSLFMGSFLLHTLFTFNFLIGYEQTDYTVRIVLLGFFTLLPIFLRYTITIATRIWSRGRIWRAGTMAGMTCAALAGLYLSYPQHVDGYSMNRSFNTSAADIDAVRWIDADAQGSDYIVLANQAVSAAAIRELGFKKYFHPSSCQLSNVNCQVLFYYPLPTGSPLYQYYLSMVNTAPTAETMRAAASIVGVHRVYFVLNSYWNDFDRLKIEADANMHFLRSINGADLIYSL